MWIKWNENRLLGIPAGKEKMLSIMPGVQYVEDKYWKLARGCVLAKIKKNKLVEYEPKLVTGNKGAGGKDMPDTYEETAFADLKDDTQEAMISECYSIPTLTLMKNQAKESLRILINNQIETMTQRPGKRD